MYILAVCTGYLNGTAICFCSIYLHNYVVFYQFIHIAFEYHHFENQQQLLNPVQKTLYIQAYNVHKY